MDKIRVGDTIPGFALPDQDGKTFDLKKYLGKKKLVIFFYPQDGSLNCTRQACYFRDMVDVFEDAGAIIVGISSQSVESHNNFATANGLNYRILSDQYNEVRRLFGVPSRFLGLIPGRVTYVTDLSGKVVYIFDSQTDTGSHVDEALRIVLLLKKNDMKKKDKIENVNN
jgi:thioredoxin-dependent peroxiredoxin